MALPWGHVVKYTPVWLGLLLAACAPTSTVSARALSTSQLERAISWRDYLVSACQDRTREQCIEYWRHFETASLVEVWIARAGFERRLRRAPNIAIPPVRDTEVLVFVDPRMPSRDEAEAAAILLISRLGAAPRVATTPCETRCLNLFYVGGGVTPGGVASLSDDIVRPLTIARGIEPYFHMSDAASIVPVMLSYNWSIGFASVRGDSVSVFCSLTFQGWNRAAHDELVACIAGGFRFPCSEACRGNQNLGELSHVVIRQLEGDHNND